MTAAAKEPRAVLDRRPHVLGLLAQLGELRNEVAGVRYWLAHDAGDADAAAVTRAWDRLSELRTHTTAVYQELLDGNERRSLPRQTVAKLAVWELADLTEVIGELVRNVQAGEPA